MLGISLKISGHILLVIAATAIFLVGEIGEKRRAKWA
jgi:hypothetical protein